jgi:hypothetical protein
MAWGSAAIGISMRAMGAMGVMRPMGIPMAAAENSRGIFLTMAMENEV